MKLAVPNSYIKTTEQEIKDIESPTDLQVAFIDNESYRYCVMSKSGEFQPVTSETDGWWSSRGIVGFRSIIHVVADSYDFEANNETDYSSIINWDIFQRMTIDISIYRGELIDNDVANWATLTDTEKRVLVRCYVWPQAATDIELDALYSDDERESYKGSVLDQHKDLGMVIIKSSDSDKQFNVVTDDLGELTTTEITAWIKIK